MFTPLFDSFNYLHPILSHFPIALLVTSWLLDLAARWKRPLHESAWLLLVLGTLGTIPAVITGIIDHFPYEQLSVAEAVETHQFLGMGTMVIFLGLTMWRWRSRRGPGDVGRGWLYTTLMLIGIGVLTLTGANGGHLVYELGVGVKEIVR